jgi:hypothetical protein
MDGQRAVAQEDAITSDGTSHKVSDDTVPNFKGKLVVCYVASPPRGMDGGVLMEFAEFRRFGQKLFLVGRVPEKVDASWASRLQSGIAWDAVVHYLVFDSREDYERRTAAGKGNLMSRLFGRGAG